MSDEELDSLRSYILKHPLNYECVVPYGQHGLLNVGLTVRLGVNRLIVHTPTYSDLFYLPADVDECKKLAHTLLVKASLGAFPDSKISRRRP